MGPEIEIDRPCEWLSRSLGAARLKMIQKVATLSVLGVFSVLYLNEPRMWNHPVGFAFVTFGAFVIFNKWT